MSAATVRVEWTTTITEKHEAWIDAENWDHMVSTGNIADGLGDYEDANTSLKSVAVEDRDASVSGVAL